jgi:hypothetical protein
VADDEEEDEDDAARVLSAASIFSNNSAGIFEDIDRIARRIVATGEEPA